MGEPFAKDAAREMRKELAKLEAEQAKAKCWGAAVGERGKRIDALRRELARQTETSAEAVEQSLLELQDIVRCRCHPGYTGMGLRDPACECDSAEALKVVADRIEELERLLGLAEDQRREWEHHCKTAEAERGKQCGSARLANTSADVIRGLQQAVECEKARQPDTSAETVWRYKCGKNKTMVLDCEGNWVKHSDYATLAAERDALQAKLDEAVQTLTLAKSWIEKGSDLPGPICRQIDATIAKLKGATDD